MIQLKPVEIDVLVNTISRALCAKEYEAGISFNDLNVSYINVTDVIGRPRLRWSFAICPY